MTKQVTLGFYGGAGDVTGANFILTLPEGKSIMVDCGMVQGILPGEPNPNYDDFAYDPKTIDVLLVTHAHADHIGRIGKLVKDGFRGVIYSTPATKDLAEVMLADTLHIMSREAEKEGLEPLFSEKDLDTAFSLWKKVSYHNVTQLFDDLVTFEFLDAGHIMGSAMIRIVYNQKNIVFTGDLGNTPTLLLREPEVIDNADYLIMESVYGNKNHEERGFSRQVLEDAIEDTVQKGGVLMMPVFSIERTQEILFELNELIEEGRVPAVPVFLDSPLAISATRVYEQHADHFKPAIKQQIKEGDNIFNFPGLKMTAAVEDSKAINDVPAPKIIMAGSGMSTGGRILHHEKHHLPDPNSTLLLLGYQAAGTLGRILQSQPKSVTIHRTEVPVKAKVLSVSGYSGHMGRDDLISFVSNTAKRVTKVFCVMGEDAASLFLVQRLRDYLGVKAYAPKQGDSVQLEV